MYVGPFAKKCREYATRFYLSSWCILSAKYGFLLPNYIVPGPYNVSFNDRKTDPITIEELSVQVKEKGLSNHERIIILGGKNYVEMANEVFSSKEILSPLSDCKGMGYMMGKLNDSIKRGVPL
ncbi:MAG: hypothetical protein DIAAKJNI_00559 [Candidatus Argoarchaeum ethanivorans]|uniref:DUF6884 domain-containing protein n=1 Tax=Candidatus Argoarchaeum ethanivorans TaxID=2608793 RepID=A0A811T8U3_9EURY|nr:MAG: hypothetical protein DIAAKJNI_00559 [Candidatus Argoarchaeum ethanivorans]